MIVKNAILDMSASRMSYLFASLIVAIIVVATFTLLPVCTDPLPVNMAFMPMFSTTVIIIESLTAYLLVIQFRATSQPFLGGLSGAYAFVAVTAVIQLMVFPGVFGPTGLFHTSRQTSIWMWVLWHGGFPLLLAMALLLKLPPGVDGRLFIRLHTSILLMFTGPMLAIGFGALAVDHPEILPDLILDKSYLSLQHSPEGHIVIAMNVICLIICIWTSRLKDLMSLWLTVAIVANIADTVITLSAGARYSVGWYSGRMLSVVSSTIILCVLILEFSRLYGSLVASNLVLVNRVLRDGLTGVFNRSYFDEQVEIEFKRMARNGLPMALFMLDVDHFKAYNDVNGHQKGDQCLILLTQTVQNILKRPADFIARYGGEEFAVVLPETDRDTAIALAEEMCLSLSQMHLDPSAHTKPITVSIGLVIYQPGIDDYDASEMIRRADLALYAVKRGGRNGIKLFEMEVAPIISDVLMTASPTPKSITIAGAAD